LAERFMHDPNKITRSEQRKTEWTNLIVERGIVLIFGHDTVSQRAGSFPMLFAAPNTFEWQLETYVIQHESGVQTNAGFSVADA
jgi:hypothetical protein